MTNRQLCEELMTEFSTAQKHTSCKRLISCVWIRVQLMKPLHIVATILGVKFCPS